MTPQRSAWDYRYGHHAGFFSFSFYSLPTPSTPALVLQQHPPSSTPQGALRTHLVTHTCSELRTHRHREAQTQESGALPPLKPPRAHRKPPAAFDWFFEASRPHSLEDGKSEGLGLEGWEGGPEASWIELGSLLLPADPQILWQFPPDFREQVFRKHPCHPRTCPAEGWGKTGMSPGLQFLLLSRRPCRWCPSSVSLLT